MTAAVATQVIYEVDLDLDAAIDAEYRRWLDAHIVEILALPGFLGARLAQVDEPAAEAGRVRLCVQYLLRDEAALQHYFDEHAPRLRGQGQARFAGRFNARRRVMRVLASFAPQG